MTMVSQINPMLKTNYDRARFGLSSKENLVEIYNRGAKYILMDALNLSLNNSQLIMMEDALKASHVLMNRIKDGRL